MPKVTTYDTPQVEARALPGARQASVASPALFGADADNTIAMGKGMLTAGTGVANAAYLMQERENADMVFRAETAFKDDYLKFEQTVRSRKGMDAWGATVDAEKWFEEQKKKHSETLGNDAQRYIFDKQFQKLRLSSMGTIANYESDQRHRSVEESANASIVGSVNMAASAAADGFIVASGENTGDAKITKDKDGNTVVSAPGVTVGRNPIPGIKQDILNRIEVVSRQNGWSSERKEMEVGKHITNLHKQVIQVLADKDPAAARKYLDANKAEINGSELEQIEKVVRLGGLRGEAQAWVDKLDPAQEEKFALDGARIEFKDKPELRDAVIGEVKNRFQERRQLREMGQKDAADQAWKIASEAGMKAVPSALIASMDGRDVETMRTHFANKAAGVNVKTNPDTYYDLRLLSANDPGAFKRVDLRRYVNDLSPSDFQEFVKLQTNDNDRTDAATLTQQLSNTHDVMKWGSGDKVKKGAFDKAVTDAINVEQQRTGKKLNYEERQKIIDKMLIQGEVDGSGWFSDSMRYFEAKPEDRAKFAPDISSEDRKAIIQRHKELKGYFPSEKDITDVYKRMKGL